MVGKGEEVMVWVFDMLGKEKGMKGALVSLTVWSQKVKYTFLLINVMWGFRYWALVGFLG